MPKTRMSAPVEYSTHRGGTRGRQAAQHVPANRQNERHGRKPEPWEPAAQLAPRHGSQQQRAQEHGHGNSLALASEKLDQLIGQIAADVFGLRGALVLFSHGGLSLAPCRTCAIRERDTLPALES